MGSGALKSGIYAAVKSTTWQISLELISEQAQMDGGKSTMGDISPRNVLFLSLWSD
jgi:hypothetical protein